MCPLALEGLPAGTMRNAIERANRPDRIPKVFLQPIVGFHFSLDRVQHARRRSCIRSDHDNKFAMAVNDCPNGSAFRDRRLAGAARHGHGEESAIEHGAFYFLDNANMIRREF